MPQVSRRPRRTTTDGSGRCCLRSGSPAQRRRRQAGACRCCACAGWLVARDEIRDPAWRDAADALGARLGLPRPVRLLVSADVGTPMAGGVWRPTIFLPASRLRLERRTPRHRARPRDRASRRCAIRCGTSPRGSPSACYWFHPLAWIAARQATLAREQACDEAVLALGTRPSTYARVLLDLAESLRSPVTALGALPMVERSLLEKRLMAILSDSHPAIARRAAAARRRHGAADLHGRCRGTGAAAPAAPPSAATIAPLVAATVSASPMATPQAEARPAAVATAPTPAQTAGRESACGWDSWDSIGSRGGDRVIQKVSAICACVCWARRSAIATGRSNRASGSASRGAWSSSRAGATRSSGSRWCSGRSGPQTIWQVGGVERTLDKAAEQWRERMLAVLDTTWELSSLRGQVSSLRGQISSVRGQESSLRGEISSLRGEVSSMRGRASSVRGEESSLRGRSRRSRGTSARCAARSPPSAARSRA